MRSTLENENDKTRFINVCLLEFFPFALRASWMKSEIET